MYDRTEKPVLDHDVVVRDTSHEPDHYQGFVESTHSASYLGWDDDKT